MRVVFGKFYTPENFADIERDIYEALQKEIWDTDGEGIEITIIAKEEDLE